MYCIFCYGEFFDKGHSPTKLDARRNNRLKIGEAFHKTIRNVLGVQPKCNLGKDSFESSCNNCLHIINNYCKLAFQAQCLQLRLNWETQQLLSVIKRANSNSTKHKRFRENFIIPEDIPTIFKFRQDILTKGAQELVRHTGPIVSLDKINVKIPNKKLPQNNNDGDTTSSDGYIDDKENSKSDAQATLKICSTTSLQNVNVIEETTNEEGITRHDCEMNAEMNISISNGSCNKSMNTGDENNTVMELEELVLTYTSITGQPDHPEDISGVELIEPKCENDANYETSSQHDDDVASHFEDNVDISYYGYADLHTPNVVLTVPQETFNTNMMTLQYQDEISNSVARDSSEGDNFMYLTNNEDGNDTEHDVSGNAFICHIPGCGKSFEITYQSHHGRHEDRHEMVACSYCGKGFLNDNFLRQHMKIHDVILPSLATHKQWTCEKCNTQYSTKFNLRRHIMTLHPSDPLPLLAIPKTIKRGFKPSDPSQKQERVISFGSLHRIFKKRDQSSVQRIRWRSPKHRCAICRRLCPNSFKLNEHMRTHSGERPFGCVFCTSRFATKSNLKRHARLVHKITELGEARNEN